MNNGPPNSGLRMSNVNPIGIGIGIGIGNYTGNDGGLGATQSAGPPTSSTTTIGALA